MSILGFRYQSGKNGTQVRLHLSVRPSVCLSQAIISETVQAIDMNMVEYLYT